MRKWIVYLLLLLIVSLAAIYFFIPGRVLFGKATMIPGNNNALHRVIFDVKRWGSWMRGADSSAQDNNRSFQHEGLAYTLKDLTIASVLITIKDKDSELPTSLTLINSGSDSVGFVWEGSLEASYNPIKRITNYFRAKKLSKSMGDVLDRMLSFYSDNKNLYGTDIKLESVVDSILVFTSTNTKEYPSTEFVYSLIDQLRAYVEGQSAKATGLPMLNVYRVDSGNYLVKVALPVDRRLPGGGNISHKGMMGGGKILTADVKGGRYNVERVLAGVETYINDNHFDVPAIPFGSLITDRRQEPDSTKWITRIYYPIM